MAAALLNGKGGGMRTLEELCLWLQLLVLILKLLSLYL